MATANNKTTTDVPDIAEKVRAQLLSTVKRGQQLSVDAAQTWVKAVSVIPVPGLPKLPGAPTFPGLEASTTFVFDVATDLLNAQRAYALQMANIFATAKSA